MSDAGNLIGRIERQTGKRWDENDGDNDTMTTLFGIIAMAMGEAPRDAKPQDAFAIGTVVRHQMSPEGRREQVQKEMLANLFAAGFSPDDVAALLGNNE